MESTGNMELERVTEKNIGYAIEIQEELFPGESGRTNFEESIYGSAGFEYFLLYEDGTCVGIIGIYSYPEDPKSAWLGWFGIRKDFRRKHLGSEALKRFETMAAERGYRYTRLYTDAENNDAAIAFYQANGYAGEPYQNSSDPACLKYKMLIFSKSLTAEPLVLWNSRNIHLTEQIAKQEKYNDAH